MRTAGPYDAPGMYSVCLRTADVGGDASHLHDNPDLLGHVYVGPYLAADPACCLALVDDAGVAGFVVATADTTAFERWRDEVWLPPLRAQYPIGSGTGRDRALTALLHHPQPTPPALLAPYPAHLHIDLLPRVQGQGWGRRLIDELCDRLRSRGVTGLHLGVGVDNVRAIGFYERLGLTEALRTEGTIWSVFPLQP